MSRESGSVGEARQPKRRRRMLWWLVAIVPVMFAFAFVNIPLFRVFCEHYGIGFAPVHAATATVKDGRPLAVLFSGEVAAGLPLEFHPLKDFQQTRVGERTQNGFTFYNPTDHAVRFRAIHAIYPEDASKQLALIQCFCFSDQTLGPHQGRTLPVIYQVNQGLNKGVTQLTMNYTLFPK